MKCFAHISGISGDIRPFQQDTWLKYLYSVHTWRDLDGNQAEIARNFVKEFGEIYDTSTNCVKDTLTIPQDGGYHKRCYQYFTDISKQRRALASKSKRKATQGNRETKGQLYI